MEVDTKTVSTCERQASYTNGENHSKRLPAIMLDTTSNIDGLVREVQKHNNRSKPQSSSVHDVL